MATSLRRASKRKHHYSGIMNRLRALVVEIRARRAGRRGLTSDTARAARDVAGGIGAATSAAWDQMETNKSAYLKSFDRRLPPSLHISERDRVRAGDPIPTSERCIEDWVPRDS